MSKKYDERHGGPYDRGGADSYYRRPFRPHYYEKGTGTSPEHLIEEGTPEWEQYAAGYSDNEERGDFKDWG